jgi:flavin reductase (DIM6/NTAB) family NADH-FMN oxidoreductase RutF
MLLPPPRRKDEDVQEGLEALRPAGTPASARIVDIPTAEPVWSRFFTVAPLILVGTREGDGFDVAPKHLAMPLGWANFFGFVCTPRHATYRNVVATRQFTVSFPRPEQIVEAGLAAGARAGDASKPTLAALRTVPARVVDGILVEGCSVFLECELERIVDGFGENSLVVGRVVAASADERVLRGPEVDDADLLYALPPVAYLSPGRFAPVRETFSFPFPSDFSL